jgi:DNA-binding CsgD family transcriptional regulator
MGALPMAMLDVIDALYAAALDPTLWNEALYRLARVVDGTAAGVCIERFETAVVQRCNGLDSNFMAAYGDHYRHEDPWLNAARTLPVRSVRYGEALVARPRLLKSAFYNELSRPYEIDDLMVIAAGRTATEFTLVYVAAGLRKSFSKNDGAIVELLVPHLCNALAIGQRLSPLCLDQLRSTSSVDAARTPRTLHDHLRLEFGLTPTEARVAVHVGRGMAPKQTAAALGTSWNTVRFQLRQVYAKTHTSGQSELARLIMRTELTC